jgi:hypothetical protein
MKKLLKVLAADAVRFIGEHALIGLLKATGVKRTNAKVRNTQCVKLTRNHKNLLQSVSFWCSLRVNKLQQLGGLKEVVDKIILNDARFLNVLSFAIEEQREKEPAFDAWLFFNEDIQSTDFFELQHCSPGGRVTKVSYTIHNEG